MDEQVLLFISVLMVYLFILVEVFRNNDYMQTRSILKGLIKNINSFLKENIDNRDDEKFIVTHLFLLTGCFSTYLMAVLYSKENNDEILKYLGLIILGVGDSCASIVGSKYGRIKMFPPTDRTLEGFSAGVLSSLIVMGMIKWPGLEEIIRMGIVFLYEGYTLEIDNLVLPVFAFYIFNT